MCCYFVVSQFGEVCCCSFAYAFRQGLCKGAAYDIFSVRLAFCLPDVLLLVRLTDSINQQKNQIMKSISIKWTNRYELADKLDYLATQYARMEFISRANQGVRMCDTYACYPI